MKCDIKMKITFQNDSFGPGIVEIMSLVDKTNNLSEAYRIMGLSSSKGWKIIKRAEKELGFPIFISEVGGRGGGSTKLTAEGKELLEKYQVFMEELHLEAERLFEKHFKSF